MKNVGSNGFITASEFRGGLSHRSLTRISEMEIAVEKKKGPLNGNISAMEIFKPKRDDSIISYPLLFDPMEIAQGRRNFLKYYRIEILLVKFSGFIVESQLSFYPM